MNHPGFTDPSQPQGPAQVHPGRQAPVEGCVERVQQAILEERWKPTFARYLIPEYTGLRQDLERYLHLYQTHRTHHVRLTKGGSA